MTVRAQCCGGGWRQQAQCNRRQAVRMEEGRLTRGARWGGKQRASGEEVGPGSCRWRAGLCALCAGELPTSRHCAQGAARQGRVEDGQAFTRLHRSIQGAVQRAAPKLPSARRLALGRLPPAQAPVSKPDSSPAEQPHPTPAASSTPIATMARAAAASALALAALLLALAAPDALGQTMQHDSASHTAGVLQGGKQVRAVGTAHRALWATRAPPEPPQSRKRAHSTMHGLSYLHSA